MDDKAFNLLERIYLELQDTKNELLETKKEVKENGGYIIRLENDFHNKFGALSDEVKVVRDDVKYIKKRIDAIEEKVERHDIKIQVIEGGKSKITV